MLLAIMLSIFMLLIAFVAIMFNVSYTTTSSTVTGSITGSASGGTGHSWSKPYDPLAPSAQYFIDTNKHLVSDNLDYEKIYKSLGLYEDPLYQTDSGVVINTDKLKYVNGHWQYAGNHYDVLCSKNPDKHAQPTNVGDVIPRIIHYNRNHGLIDMKTYHTYTKLLNQNPTFEFQFQDHHARKSLLDNYFEEEVSVALHNCKCENVKQYLVGLCTLYLVGGYFMPNIKNIKINTTDKVTVSGEYICSPPGDSNIFDTITELCKIINEYNYNIPSDANGGYTFISSYLQNKADVNIIKQSPPPEVCKYHFQSLC